jgi:hypothetical protein
MAKVLRNCTPCCASRQRNHRSRDTFAQQGSVLPIAALQETVHADRQLIVAWSRCVLAPLTERVDLQQHARDWLARQGAAADISGFSNSGSYRSLSLKADLSAVALPFTSLSATDNRGAHRVQSKHLGGRLPAALLLSTCTRSPLRSAITVIR